MNIHRRIQSRILQSLTSFPVVAILGARQVGKTTLAKSIAGQFSGRTVYLDLELDGDLHKLDQPQLYLEQHCDSLIILDEIHRKPELFPLIRALVDQDRRTGRFLVLGSASPDLLRQSSESLAGRIYYHELSPFSISEVGNRPDPINDLWLRGGFPDSFLATTPEVSIAWRETFVSTFLQRDMPSFGIRIPATTLKRFWTMLAHCHGQIWNAGKIAAGLGVSDKSVRHYLDILQDTFMVRQLQPYYANTKKRMIKSPKVYLRDSGILHFLLKVYDMEDLYAHPIIGPSWEGWCIEQIGANLPAAAEMSFYRSNAGAEIDLLIHRSAAKPIIAVEFKRSLDCRLTRSFRNAFADIQPAIGFIVYPGTDSFPLDTNIRTLPVHQLDELFEQAM
ncbi:MAG: ATP-binding protein [Phycisphaerae bacterium]|nr:ATP-binding protein [Phycisphaerae bacterium]